MTNNSASTPPPAESSPSEVSWRLPPLLALAVEPAVKAHLLSLLKPLMEELSPFFIPHFLLSLDESAGEFNFTLEQFWGEALPAMVTLPLVSFFNTIDPVSCLVMHGSHHKRLQEFAEGQAWKLTLDDRGAFTMSTRRSKHAMAVIIS